MYTRSSFVVAIVVLALALYAGSPLAQTPDPDEKISPIRIERSFLEGKGLTPGDPTAFDDYVERDDDDTGAEPTATYSTHSFHTGKIEVSIYESDPGKVRIDNLPYDEYVLILEGRLILSHDDGETFEFEEGDSLIVPEGFTGYWHMPVKYRELIIVNTG